MKLVDINMNKWLPWMRRALQLASLADGQTSPNPLVGAVVLDTDGNLVGEGFHSSAGMPHAEVNALSQAGSSSKGGTLVVTLEPCCHQGRTPPCTEAIIKSGVSRVVVAIEDPDPRVAGGGVNRLKDAGLEVITGLLKEQAAFQNRSFIFRVKNKRPWGILKWAMSLDGRTALPNGQSKWISCSRSRDWVYKLRAKSDAVIVGSGTVRTDNPLLTSRGLSSPEPLRVVLSRSLQLPLKAELWNTSQAKTIIAYGPDADDGFSKKLQSGPDFASLPAAEPLELLKLLASKNCNTVLWECGSELATQAIKQECVQELAVFVAPKLIGGIPAKTPLSDFGFNEINQAFKLTNISSEKLEVDWLFKILLEDQLF